MMQRIIASLALAVGFCLVSSSAEAFLTSVKAVGMGGVAVAFPQDALVTAYNPAGMAEMGDRLDLGLNWAHFVGDARIHGNIFPGVNGRFNGYRTKNFYSPDVGINRVFGCDGRLSLGFAVYNRQLAKTSYRVAFPLLGTSPLGLEYINQEFAPTIAYKLTPTLDIGLSIRYNIHRLKVNGLQNFAVPGRSAYPNRATNKGYNYRQGVGVALGALWYVTPCLSVGATYTPETHMSRFYRYKGFLAQAGKFNLPPLYSIGISYRPWECLTVAFDIQYQDWSRIKAVNFPLIHNNTIEPLGSKHGPGFGWSAQTFYRVGINWDVDQNLTVRAGYRHANTPIRPSQTVVNLFTLEPLTRDVVMGGVTWRFSDCNEASAYFAYGIDNRVKGKNSIPPPFGGGEADLRQQVSLIGISCGHNF